MLKSLAIKDFDFCLLSTSCHEGGGQQSSWGPVQAGSDCTIKRSLVISCSLGEGKEWRIAILCFAFHANDDQSFY